MKLAGKVALVTGASRGIGRAIALAMGCEGADVAVNYASNESAAQAVVAELEAMGRRALPVACNVSVLDDVKAMVAAVTEGLGAIDILVNNAGIMRDNYVVFMKDDEWNDVMDVNLKGAFYCIKVVGREMMRAKSGKIVNISSDAGLLGDMLRANYSASKSGLHGLTRSAARELANYGVNVNAIAPGIIETDMTAGTPPPKREKQLAMIPQARFGKPEEVAEVAVFLASAASDYITGQVISVDGGLRM